MIGSFYAPRFKIGRARKHLAELEAEIRAFLEKRPPRFETKVVDSDGTRRFEFELHVVQPGPLFGAIVGDVVHNLRAALDLAACDLVRFQEGKDADVDDVQFPFCRRADDLDAAILRRQFHRAGTNAVHIVIELKPYVAGNPLLRAIHDLDAARQTG